MAEAMQNLRNTPMQNHPSPSQLFFGRPQRTATPALPSFFNTQKYKRIIKNETNNKPSLPQLAINQKVLIQQKVGPRKGQWDVVGIVESFSGTNRSYIVRTQSGLIHRNRRFIKPISNKLFQKFAPNWGGNEPTDPPQDPTADPTPDRESGARSKRTRRPPAEPTRRSNRKRTPKEHPDFV